MPDQNSKISRRQLFAATSKAAVAGTLGMPAITKAAAGAANTATSLPAENLARKIVNYNPKMKYRRLGKTDLILSEVSLGGHWKNRNAGSFWSEFANDEVPADVAQNRTEVVSKCIDVGVNYVDITTAGECLAYGAALKGRREKFIVGADDHRLCLRSQENINLNTQMRNIDECLRRLKSDYMDIWRVQARQSGKHPLTDVEPAIEAAEKAKKAGKIRHFGLSSHNRSWLEQVVKKYPQVEMVVFPVTAMTKEKGLPITKENITESKQHHKNAQDRSKSIFETVHEKNVGVVTIKPFAGGYIFPTFTSQTQKFPVMGVGLKEENDLARLTIQCILTRFGSITCAVPGMTTVYEVDNAVRASYQRDLAMLPAEEEWLENITKEQLANLPPDYQWLRNWDVI